MAIDVRVTVIDPKYTTVLALDASADFSGGQLQYEDTPAGCGSARLTLGLYYDQMISLGYWSPMNLVEISTGDSVLTTAIASGATKAYVDSNAPFDPAKGEDGQVAYFWDGSTLTMRVPVTGVGTDGGGQYITLGTPIAGAGNPTTLAAYAPGTIVGRRRYAGRILRRARTNERRPHAELACAGLSTLLRNALGNFTIGAANNIDVGAAMFACFNQFSTRLSFLTIASANFPVVGTTYSGTSLASSLDRVIPDIISAVTNGDLWVLRIGHDRTPRLVKLYTSATNTYTYPIAMPQGVQYYEPVGVQVQDDASSLFNAVQVIGDTDPATKQPVTALVTDTSSIALYGQLDLPPVNNTKCKTVSDCARYAAAILLQSSIATQHNNFRVFTYNEGTPVIPPGGALRGDVVRGVNAVTITRFDSTGTSINNVPDSEIQYGTGPASLWSISGLTIVNGVGPNGSNVWASLTGTGSAIGNLYSASSYVDVTPGQVLTLDGFIDATAVTGASLPYWQVTDVAISTAYATTTQAAGTSGRVPAIKFTVPAGVSKVLVLCHTNNAIVAAGQTIKYAQPQLIKGSVTRPYAINYATPAIYGLANSVVSTYLPKGDSFQDCSFAAIEPDWNATLSEKANSLATALRQNTAVQPGLDQYFVSYDAFGYTSSGLVITTPSFQAVFALGSQPITVGGNTFTIAANATSFVWLMSTNTWIVNQDPHIVPGAILYAIFQANATSVIGSTNKAAIGALKQPMSYLVNNAAFVPTMSANAVTNDIPGNYTSQVKIVFTTTQPADGSHSKTRCYYRQPGQPTYLMLNDVAPNNTSGVPTSPANPSATGAYTFRLPDATNGIGYEFAYALESGGSAETTPISIGTITPMATATAATVTPPQTITGANNTNLLSDSNFFHSSFTSAIGNASSTVYWTGSLDGLTYGIGKGGAADGSNYWYANYGPPDNVQRFLTSQIVYVNTTASTTFTASVYVGGGISAATGNGAFVQVLDSNGSTNYGIALVGSNLNGRLQVQAVVPAGVTAIMLRFGVTGTYTIRGSRLIMAQPQLELGSTMTGYKPTIGVQNDGTVAHPTLPGSVTTVIGPGGTVNVNPPGGVTGNLPIGNHAPGVQSTVVGNFVGATLDNTTGYYVIPSTSDSPTPSSKPLTQNTIGTITTFEYTFVPTVTNPNAIGWVLFSDATSSAAAWTKGYLIQIEGTTPTNCNIYRKASGTYSQITPNPHIATVPYDMNPHTLKVVATYTAATQIDFACYIDGILVSLGTDTSLTPYLSGTCGPVNRSSGANTILVDPKSMAITQGADAYEEAHTAFKAVIGSNGNVNVNPVGGVIGILPMSNHNQAVVAGATGASYNLVADSGFTFGNFVNGTKPNAYTTSPPLAPYWDTSTNSGVPSAWSVHQNFATSNYGNAMVYTATGTGYNAQGNRFVTSRTICLSPGTYTISGVIDATNCSAGASPLIGVYNLAFNTIYGSGTATNGSLTRVSGTVTIPAGPALFVKVILFLNNVTMNVNSQMAFYQIQLQSGPYVTAFELTAGDPAQGFNDINALDPNVALAQNRNMLINGGFAKVGSQYGWSRLGGATGTFDQLSGTYTTGGGGTVTCEHFVPVVSGGGANIYQNIAVKEGQTYSFAALLNATNSGGSQTARVFITNAANLTGTQIVPNGFPVGNVPLFYTGSGASSQQSNSGVTAYNIWSLINGTFTVPVGTRMISFSIQTSGPGASDLYCTGAMMCEGSKWQDFNESTFVDPNNSQTSSVLNAQGSLASIPQNLITYTSTTASSGAASITFSWVAFNIYYPDGSSVTVAAGSRVFPVTASSTSSTPYYYNMWWNVNSSPVIQIALSDGSGNPSVGQRAMVNGDGNTPINIAYLATVPMIPASGSTGGGGGSRPPTCPAVGQQIETQERGFIVVEQLEAGMHLRDPLGRGWNEVHRVQVVPGQIVDIKLDHEWFSVDTNHRWLKYGGDPDRDSSDWVWVGDLSLNTVLQANGRESFVKAIGEPKQGHYVEITCERSCFSLGAAAHNVYTLPS